MYTQSKDRSMRFAALSTAILIVSILTVMAIPPVRSFAQSLIERVGGFGFSEGIPQPLDASRVPGPISILRTLDSVAVRITSENVATTDNPAEASNLAGFTVLVPSYLPSDYTTTSDWFVITEGNGMVVTTDYHDTAKNMLFLNQWKFGDGELKTFTRQQIVDVTVRGRDGVWLPEPSSPDGNQALVWEENGITYSLIGDALSLDEMLRVAESLGQ